MARNCDRQPSFLRILQSPFLLTVSNAFVRSTKVMNIVLLSALCLRAITMSVVPRLGLKPHWLSGRCSSAIVGTSLLAIILLRFCRRWREGLYRDSLGSQTFPFFLYWVIMTASRRSCRSFPCSQQQTKNSWSLILIVRPPFFPIFGGMP